MPPADSSKASIRVQRRIEWSDTDASGHHHFLAGFRLFEAAEVALLSRLGMLDLFGRLPRVHASAEFRSVLHLHDLVDITMWVEDVGRSSVTYRFEVRRDEEMCLEGKVVGAQLDEAEGEKEVWSAERRRLFMTSGAQRPELLVEPTPADPR